MKLRKIRDQVVVLLGASSGIGRQAALDFSRRGAKVVVAARDEGGLRSLVSEIQAAGGQAIYRVADAANFEDVRAVGDAAVAAYGRIDTWVHLAAVSLYATFEQTTPDEWKRVIDVNLNGQAYGAMVAIPHLRAAGGGALIHISSIEAKRALPYQAAYAASKHGISGMLEALRVELKREGVPISVSEIMPATIDTPFFDKARTKIGVKPVGMPPIYPPEAVADAILHCAEHPTREFTVGGAGKLIRWTQDLAPGLADRMMLSIGFRQQKTEMPKAESAPDNLYQTLPGHATVKGSYSERSLNRASYNWIEKHPTASRLLAVGALTAIAALALRDNKTARYSQFAMPVR